MRRQQAQEENEARELGLLYNSSSNIQTNMNDGQQTSGYHSGIPSPPNDSDGGQRNYAGSESGKFAINLDGLDNVNNINKLILRCGSSKNSFI